MTRKDKVLIANGQGFWGDSILGPIRLVREGPLDYLTLDYLAEVTMSIMQKLRSRRPESGYATDFVKLIERILPQVIEKDVRIVANAGGRQSARLQGRGHRRDRAPGIPRRQGRHRRGRRHP